jgi:hypothetical protein
VFGPSDIIEDPQSLGRDKSSNRSQAKEKVPNPIVPWNRVRVDDAVRPQEMGGRRVSDSVHDQTDEAEQNDARNRTHDREANVETQ